MIKKLTIFILLANLIYSQSPDELKRFMETYDKIKVDQEANELVRKGIESEKKSDDYPVRLLVKPADISKYYREKLNVIQKDLYDLNQLLFFR